MGNCFANQRMVGWLPSEVLCTYLRRPLGLLSCLLHEVEGAVKHNMHHTRKGTALYIAWTWASQVFCRAHVLSQFGTACHHYCCGLECCWCIPGFA